LPPQLELATLGLLEEVIGEKMTEFAIHGSVAVLTMDDGKANVVGHGLLDDLEAALDSAETGAQAIVLAGRAGMFSGGFDLNELKKGPWPGCKVFAALVQTSAARGCRCNRSWHCCWCIFVARL